LSPFSEEEGQFTMLKYAAGRLLIAVPTFIAVILITFTLSYFSPFDPVTLMMQQYAGTLDSAQREDLVQ
jgi:ABC-type dipeptide/oligopeptide/nickel transport system permease component